MGFLGPSFSMYQNQLLATSFTHRCKASVALVD